MPLHHTGPPRYSRVPVLQSMGQDKKTDSSIFSTSKPPKVLELTQLCSMGSRSKQGGSGPYFLSLFTVGAVDRMVEHGVYSLSLVAGTALLVTGALLGACHGMKR